jgi:hypothetical protein
MESVALMGETRNACRILVGKSLWKLSLWRARGRRETLRWILRRWNYGNVVDEAASGSFPMMGFGISGVTSPCSDTTVSYILTFPSLPFSYRRDTWFLSVRKVHKLKYNIWCLHGSENSYCDLLGDLVGGYHVSEQPASSIFRAEVA